jgi:hypothetical protein
VQGAGNVRGRNGNDEGALGLDIAIGAPFGLEEILLFPPVEAASLNNFGVVGVCGLLLLNLGDFLVSLGSSGGLASGLSLLLSKFLRLFGLLALALD